MELMNAPIMSPLTCNSEDRHLAESEDVPLSNSTSHDERVIQNEGAQCETKEQLKQRSLEYATSLFRDFTSWEKSIIKQAIYGTGNPTDILASCGNDRVLRTSMVTLKPAIWLNDEVINFFLTVCLAQRDKILCANHPGRKQSYFFSTFFMQLLFDEKNLSPRFRGRYSYKAVQKWSDKVPGGDIFNLKYVFCPINHDNLHWTLAVIFMEKKEIKYYDSLGNTDKNKLEGLLKYVKDEWSSKRGQSEDIGKWKLVHCPSRVPRQRNGYDCGVFVCMISDFVVRDLPLLFNQEHVDVCREHIALNIMMCSEDVQESQHIVNG